MSQTDNSPNNYKPWQWWYSFGFIGVAALLTIVLFIYEHPRLAIATIVAGICACIGFQILRCYSHFKKIREYVTACERAACKKATENVQEKVAAAEKKAEKLLEAAEKRAEEKIAVVTNQAKEAIVAAEKQAEKAIAVAEEKAEKQIDVREAALLALHELAIACVHRDDFVNIKSKELHDEIIDQDEFVRTIYGSGKEFLDHICEHIVNVFRPLMPSTVEGKAVRLWTAVRHLDDKKNVYRTISRSSGHNPLREKNSVCIPVDRGIPKLVKDKYQSDGKGVVITSPRSRDHHQQPNDKLGENESMMASPIVIGIQIPSIVILNSNIPNLFDERLEAYMTCCASIFTIALKNMLEQLK